MVVMACKETYKVRRQKYDFRAFIRITLLALPTRRNYGSESESRLGLSAEYPLL